MREELASERLKKVRDELAKRGLEAFFAVHSSNVPNYNVRYLSGFSGSTAILVISQQDAFIITDGRYFEQVEQEVVGFDLKRLPQGATYNDFLIETVRAMGVTRLGFDCSHTTVASYEKLKPGLAGVELSGVQGLVEDLRIVKSEEEIGLIRKACLLSSEAFRKLIESNVRGRTERELAAYLEHEMRLAGSERFQFEVILCSGARSSLIHGRSSDKQLEPGDLVIIDFGAVSDGYCSDMTRTCVVGRPNREQQEWFALVKTAQREAAKAALPGVACKDVDAAARKIITQAGYGEAFSHGLGHGIGLLVHEGPQLGPSAEGVLQENMVTTIEPGIYFPGKGGLRLEDDFVITKKGAVRVADGLEQKLWALKYH